MRSCLCYPVIALDTTAGLADTLPTFAMSTPLKQPARVPFGRRMALAGLLVSITVVWGWTFSLMKPSIEEYGVVPFLAVRFAIAAAALTLINLIRRRMNRRALLIGMGIGLTLGGGYLTQTYGLDLSKATNTGFLTALFVLFGPLSNRVLFRVRTAGPLWIAIGVSTFGVVLLSGATAHPDELAGDLLSVLCGLFFGLHIALLDRYAKHLDTAILTQGQITMAALVFLAIWPALQTPALPESTHVWFALVFCALVATALAFFVQTYVQSRLPAVDVSVILLTEPIFGAIFGYYLLAERLEVLQWVGVALMFGAIVVVELYPLLRNGRAKQADPPPREVDATGRP